MPALDTIGRWPVDRAAGIVVDRRGGRDTAGDPAWRTCLASVTKPLAALACLVAVEEGTLDLDAPAGPPGATVRHLLAHASGLPFEGAEPVATYLREAVTAPLGMAATELRGSPARDAWSTADDMALFAAELLVPTLITPATLAEATTEQFPGLAGVVPGFGSYDRNPWGLGVELKGAKSPHWTAPGGSPRTFGHFGAAGTFCWVDPDAGVACAVLTNRTFGDWAPALWSELSAEVLAERSEGGGQ